MNEAGGVCRRVAAASVLVLAPAAPGQGPEHWVRQAEALGVRTGVMVRELGRETVYHHRAGEDFVPASNMKLLSAAAVLAALGPAYEFKTAFLLREGRLVVRAGGDPNWITGSEHDPAEILGRVAQALTQRGVVRLRGLVLDTAPYDGPSRPAGWPRNQLETHYCAPTGGLVLEEGCFWVLITANEGSHATLELVAPRAPRRFDRRLPLTSDRRKGSVYGVRDGGDELQPRGSFYRKSVPVRVRAAVRDPEDWFHDALRSTLARAGVVIDASATAPRDADLLVERTPLSTALARSLQESVNFTAEQCLRVLAAEKRGDGSLTAGVAEMATRLRALAGHLPPGTVLADGSGLSRENRVTPAYLAEVLRATLAGPAGEEYRFWLPLAGVSGTLEDRFVGSPVADRVWAKTGWIRGASALSGVLRTRDGRDRVFSILMNYDPAVNGLNKDLKWIQERIVEAMDRGEDGG